MEMRRAGRYMGGRRGANMVRPAPATEATFGTSALR
jgi:hypothetical protein